jgi:hypothetical protein
VGVRAQVWRMLTLAPNASIREIAAATGLSYVQVKKARAFLMDPVRYRQSKQRYLRSLGVRSAAAVLEDRRNKAFEKLVPVLRLRAQGSSFSVIAAKLGLTRDQVAGRIRRARVAGLS